MLSNLFSSFGPVASFLSGLQQILPTMNSLAGQVAPFLICIAFVLLVFGSMRGFLQNDTKHFFGNLLRVVILVVLVGNWPVIEGSINNAVNAFCNLQVNSNFFTSTNATGAGRLNLANLELIISEKAAGVKSSQPGWQQALMALVSPITHPLCQILYGIYLLALLLCELIAVGMNLLQQCILIFLNLYVPIGFAEFSIPSLRGQAETFFKAYLGVQCWPIGWVLANIVTVALLQGLTPPNPEDSGAIVIAIIVCVPVLIWMMIGYILAPFYVQKIVMRGGGEIQAFAGAMIAAVGGTTGAVYGQAFALGRGATLGLSPLTQAVRTRDPGRNGGSTRRPMDAGDDQGKGHSDEQGATAENLLGHVVPGFNEIQPGGDAMARAGDKARALGGWGLTKVIDAGEFAARTAGNVASTVGSLVADASGNRIGPERYFSFPQIRQNKPNRSSQRAANYVNQ
jgi:hypothetical protein